MRVTVAGVGFDAVTERDAVDRMVAGVLGGRGGRVATPNIDFLRRTSCRPDLRSLLEGADLVLADGMPIVWASRLAGSPLPGRVAGSSLAPLLAERATTAGVGVFLLGGNPGAAATAAASLEALHPGLRVGWHDPPRGLTAEHPALRCVEESLADFGPCACLVGLGFPKQDHIGRRLLQRFPGSWFVGAGATIDFLAGARRRAPELVQRAGLEWCFRLSQEPRRLGARYAADIPYAVRMMARTAADRRVSA